MQKNKEFETAFQEYTETQNVEAAEGALMTILRNAFFAGWQAAKPSPADYVAPRAD